MKLIGNEKTMTVKEVADIMSVSERTIQRHIKEISPDKITNGEKTLLTEKEVTAIKLRIERSGRNDLDNVVGLPRTDLEKELLIEQALLFQREKIASLKRDLYQSEQRVNRLIHQNKTYTSTEIAKELNMRSAKELNKKLLEKGFQYKINGTWVLSAKYSDNGYESIKQEELDSGKIIYNRHWTGKGRDFIMQLIEYNNNLPL